MSVDVRRERDEPIRRRVSTSTLVSDSSAGCSTSAISRLAMNRPARMGVPERVTSVTSTTPRAVVISIRPAGLACDDLECLHSPARIDHGFNPVALHFVASVFSRRIPIDGLCTHEARSPLRANFLSHERDVRHPKGDHRHRNDGNELRPDDQDALVEWEQAGYRLIGL